MDKEIRKVSPSRDHREIPPFKDIKHDLKIPDTSKFIGWYINNPMNPLHFVSRTFSIDAITKSSITVGVEGAKNFKLGEFQKALDFADSLPFAATVTVIFGYVVVSDKLPADTINRAVVDPNSTEYLMFSAMALYDNKKPQFTED